MREWQREVLYRIESGRATFLWGYKPTVVY